MIILLLLGFFFGVGGLTGLVPDISEALREEISDKPRRKVMLGLYEEMNHSDAQIQKEAEDFLKDLHNLNRNRSATTEQVLEILGQMEEQRMDRRNYIVEQMLQMKSMVSEEEWKRIHTPSAQSERIKEE